jgi:small subunit ribosomal protein S20
MPIKKAAVKYMRKTRSRTQRNLKVKNKMKKLVKQSRELIAEGKSKELEKVLQQTCKALDKAAKNNIIHKNKAARLKKRLYKSRKKK